MAGTCCLYGPYLQCKAALQRWLLLHLPDVYTFRLNLLQCSLHSIKSRETRVVKKVSTKTSRDVGMVPSASKNHASLHGKTYGWKNCRNKEVNHPIPKPWYHLKEGCHLMLNNPGEHSAASDFNATLHGYVTIPTSGNIVMRLLLQPYYYSSAPTTTR